MVLLSRTNPLFSHLKVKAFKTLLTTPKSCKLLSSLLSVQSNIEEVTNFNQIKNLREKSLLKKPVTICSIQKGRLIRRKRRNIVQARDLPPDHISLKMKILQASFVTQCMSNCLKSCHVSLDPSVYKWKFVENLWEPIWFEGSPSSHADYAVDESGEVDESGMVEEQGQIISLK